MTTTYKILQLLPCTVPSTAVYWFEDDSAPFGASLCKLPIHAFALVEYPADPSAGRDEPVQLIEAFELNNQEDGAQLIPVGTARGNFLGVVNTADLDETVYLSIACDLMEAELYEIKPVKKDEPLN